MSGIAGIVRLDGAPVAPEVLAAMLKAMLHRAPDGSGQRIFGPVGLGHCLLATTPESERERQPVDDEAASCWLVGDLRLDNREELQRALERARIPLTTGTDAELVLGAYQIWGEALPGKLLGDFAFALWDGRRQQLLCARDPLGMKPFYYYLDSRCFLFASELKALFAAPGLPRQPNEVMMGLYLADNYSDREQTLYRNVFRLPGAHRLILDNRGLRTEPYWDVRFEDPIRYPRDEDYAQHFLEIFSQAVACRMRTHKPLGAFLSGGLDSGAVVSMAQHLCEKTGERKELETFSGYFLTPSCDERDYIQHLVRRWPVRAHYYHLAGVGPSTYAEEMARQYDGIHDPTLFFFRSLAEKARQAGVRVILTGTGGDDFYSGSPYLFADLLRQGRLRDVYREVNLFAQTRMWKRRTLWLYFTLFPLLPGLLKTVLRRARRRLRRGVNYPPWIAPAFAARIQLADRLRPAGSNSLPSASFSQRDLHRALQSGYWSHIVESMNSVGASQQVEFRSPFADPRLVDFALRVPAEQFQRGDCTKWALRLALKGILPEAVRLRKSKTAFDEVVEYDLRERPLVAEVLGSPRLAADGFLNVQEVKKLYLSVCGGGTGLGWRLYSIFAVELWYRGWDRIPRLFLEGQGEGDDRRRTSPSFARV